MSSPARDAQSLDTQPWSGTRSLLIFGAVIISLHITQELLIGATPVGSLIANVLQISSALLAFAMCIAALRRGTGFTRPFWLLIGLSFIAWAIADLGWVYYESVLHMPPPRDSLFHFLVDCRSLLLAMALLLDQKEEQSSRSDLAALLDLLQLSIIFLLVYLSWYYLSSLQGTRPLSILRAAQIEVGEGLTLLTLAAVQAVRAPTSAIRRLYFGFGLCFLPVTGGTFLVDYQELRMSREIPTGTWLDLWWTVPYLLAALWAARWRPGADFYPTAERDQSFVSMLFGRTIFGLGPLIVFLLAAELGSGWRWLTVFLLGLSILCLIARLALDKFREAETARGLREADRDRRASAARFRTLIEEAPLAIAISRNTKTLHGNRMFLNLFGYETVDEVIGRPIREYWSPEGRDDIEDWSRMQSLGKPTPSTYEGIAQRKDGTWFPAHIEGATVHLSDGPATITFLQDISERKQAEEALRESEERFRALFLNSPDAHYLATVREGRIIEINDAFLGLFGYSRKEVIGKTSLQLGLWADPSDRARLAEELKAHGRVSGIELVGKRKNGQLFPMSVSITTTTLRAEPHIVVAIRDVTAAKLAADKLRESEERFRSLYENSTIGLYRTTPAGEILLANPTLLKMLGHSSLSALSQRNLEADGFEPDYQRAEFRGRLANEGEIKGLESTWTRTDGTMIFVRESAKAIRGPDGKIMYFEGTVEDITERHRAEEALRRAEQEYRSIFEQATEGICRISPEGKVITANPAFARIFGYASPEEMVSAVTDAGRQIWNDPEDRRAFTRLLEKEGAAYGIESEMVRKDGAKIWLELNVRVVRACDGRVLYYAGFVNDITQRKELERQFLQAQKMEAVGRLAGGVAHDFNNLLGVITGYVDLALEDQALVQRTKQRLVEIKQATARAVQMTRQLLAFSRKQVLQTKVLDLNAVVHETVKMLARILGEHIQIVTQLEPELGWVEADPTSIDQVVVNLALNARDAMPDGGTVTIETANVHFDQRHTEPGLSQPAGHYVILTVSDTGVGMNEETQKHIFEPFFTTKEMGRGTGLGLSTVYGIVQQSKGNISFDSEPGRGTRFRIYFPRVEAAASVSEGRRSEAVPHGSETILLVEDNSDLRAVNVELLQDLGYKVIQAANAAEAIAAADEHDGPLHLLMTDVVMPGMNGRLLAERLVEQRPTLKVLYVSGYSDNLIQNTILGEGVAFLQKPISRSALAEKLRQVLGTDVRSAGATGE